MEDVSAKEQAIQPDSSETDRLLQLGSELERRGKKLCLITRNKGKKEAVGSLARRDFPIETSSEFFKFGLREELPMKVVGHYTDEDLVKVALANAVLKAGQAIQLRGAINIGVDVITAVRESYAKEGQPRYMIIYKKPTAEFVKGLYLSPTALGGLNPQVVIVNGLVGVDNESKRIFGVVDFFKLLLDVELTAGRGLLKDFEEMVQRNALCDYPVGFDLAQYSERIRSAQRDVYTFESPFQSLATESLDSLPPGEFSREDLPQWRPRRIGLPDRSLRSSDIGRLNFMTLSTPGLSRLTEMLLAQSPPKPIGS